MAPILTGRQTPFSGPAHEIGVLTRVPRSGENRIPLSASDRDTFTARFRPPASAFPHTPIAKHGLLHDTIPAKAVILMDIRLQFILPGGVGLTHIKVYNERLPLTAPYRAAAPHIRYTSSAPKCTTSSPAPAKDGNPLHERRRHHRPRPPANRLPSAPAIFHRVPPIPSTATSKSSPLHAELACASPNAAISSCPSPTKSSPPPPPISQLEPSAAPNLR